MYITCLWSSQWGYLWLPAWTCGSRLRKGQDLLEYWEKEQYQLRRVIICFEPSKGSKQWGLIDFESSPWRFLTSKQYTQYTPSNTQSVLALFETDMVYESLKGLHLKSRLMQATSKDSIPPPQPLLFHWWSDFEDFFVKNNSRILLSIFNLQKSNKYLNPCIFKCQETSSFRFLAASLRHLMIASCARVLRTGVLGLDCSCCASTVSAKVSFLRLQETSLCLQRFDPVKTCWNMLKL